MEYPWCQITSCPFEWEKFYFATVVLRTFGIMGCEPAHLNLSTKSTNYLSVFFYNKSANTGFS